MTGAEPAARFTRVPTVIVLAFVPVRGQSRDLAFAREIRKAHLGEPPPRRRATRSDAAQAGATDIGRWHLFGFDVLQPDRMANAPRTVGEMGSQAAIVHGLPDQCPAPAL